MLVFLLSFCLLNAVLGQEEIVKEHFNRNIGDGIVLLKEIDLVKNVNAYKSYLFSVEKRGAYYISAFVSGMQNQNINVYIDGKALKTGLLQPQIDGWQMCSVLSKEGNASIPIQLSSGEHTIMFSYETGEVPLIDEIALATSPEDSKIDRKAFFSWYNSLKNSMQPIDNAKKKEKSGLEEEAMKSTAMEAVLGQEPYYKYTGYIDQPFTYTYRGRFWIKAGVYTVFHTSNASPSSTDPVMHLYLESNPVSYSWSDDDGGGGMHSRIATTISVSGYYGLVVRAYSTSSYGTVNVYQNGSVIKTGAVVAGNVYYCNSDITSGLKNYFTCNPYRSSYRKPDTYLGIIQTRSHTSPIRAWNDDYGQQGGNYNWGWASRIKSDLADVNYMFVSAVSTSENGNCDIYGGNNISDIVGLPEFPYLKADDAIKSANATPPLTTPYYNCISWTGGSSHQWWWPPSPGNPFYTPVSVLKCFDNYYANMAATGVYTPRYFDPVNPAWDYTRTGATYSNSIVDLWHNPNFPFDSGYTHGSCRKPTNNHMHGYDWESKPGVSTRTFHPRHDLKGFGEWSYGDVKYYYIKSGPAGASSRETTDAEAIAAGYQVIPPREQLSSEETLKLNSLINSVSAQDRSLFTKYKSALDYELKNNKTLMIHSNPAFYKQTKEYQAFIAHCKQLGDNALPLLFIVISSDDHFIYREAINDMCYAKYGHILQEIVDDYVYRGQYTEDGKFIGFSHENTFIKFAKRILNEKF